MQFVVQRNENRDELTIKQWVSEQLQKMASTASTLETTLGSRPAIRLELAGTFGYSFQFLALLNKTDIFRVFITQPSNQRQLDPLYETLLATLRFVK